MEKILAGDEVKLKRSGVEVENNTIDIRKIGDKFYVNYYVNSQNFGMNEGTEDVAQVIADVAEAIQTIQKARS